MVRLREARARAFLLGALMTTAALTACRERNDAPPGYAASPALGSPPAFGADAPWTPGKPGAPDSAASASSPGSPGCGKAPPHRGLQHVTAMGRERAWLLDLPEAYTPSAPYPLVFVLHGGGGNAAGARAQTDLEKLAAGHAIFVYPEAVSGNWDLDAETSRNRDVALFDAILLAAHNALCIDPRRVFVTGFSNGGYMANQLGCKRGDRIRGVVSHSAGGPYETNGTYDNNGNLVCPGKAVASLVIHGNADGTVPPSEGQKSVDHWSFANRCGSGTSGANVPPCTSLQGCFQPVVVCRIPGLGHGTWGQAGKAAWTFIDSLK